MPEQYSQYLGHPDDYKGITIHPELSRVLNIKRDVKQPSLHDELSILEEAKKDLYFQGGQFGDNSAGAMYGPQAYRAYDKYDQLTTETYLKNLRLFQEDPTQENVRNTLLHTMASHHSLPLSSLFQDDNGYYNIPIPEALQSSDLNISSIQWNPNRFPEYAEDKNGGSYWNYKNGLRPDSHMFFDNIGELNRTIDSWVNYFPSPMEKQSKDLLETYNGFLDNEADKIPAEMLPTPSGFPLLGELVNTKDPSSGETAVALVVDLANLMFRDPDEDELPEQENAEEIKKFWEAKGAPSSWAGARGWLEGQIAKQYFENGKMGEDDKKSMSELLGAVARFNPNLGIPTDGSGRASLDGFKNTGYRIPYPVYVAVETFIDQQADLINNRYPPKYGISRGEYFNESNSNLLQLVKKRMQFMMKNKDGSYSTGMPVKEGSSVEDTKRMLNLLKATASFGGGLGMSGASEEEMNEVIGVMAQYLEGRNQAARMGGAEESFDSLSKDSYTDSAGREHVYNDAKRMGQYDYDPNLFAEAGFGGKQDSTWSLMEDFLRDADRYVVLQGKQGIPIQPVIEWSGLRSKEGNKEIPLRVDFIRLKGTEVKNKRELLKQINTYGFLVDTPWENENLRGSSGEGKTKIGKKDDPIVSGIRKAKRNPKLDTNKDGVVDSKDSDSNLIN